MHEGDIWVFRQDTLKRNSNRVLLGSPGVGKSVLFFIAALYKAETLERPVVYFRKTREEKNISVFVMFRTADGLRVLCDRRVQKDQFRTIAQLRRAIISGFRKEFVVFLDGPRHDAEPDLNAFYEYFCTSGGHPLPKNAQKDLFLWILDGWTETEVQLFATLLGRTAEFIQAYKVCGGCIRDIISFVDGDSDERAQVKAALKALVNRVTLSKVDLVLNHTMRENDDDKGSPDRLRTMFNGETVSKAIPDAIQIVDSAHVLQILRGRLPMKSYFAALLRGKAIKSGAIVGVYFEEILHQWFKESLPREIAKVCVSTGTTAEGVEQLVEKNTYWIPSVPNFPNIDAAVVLGRVLYSFQYTKASNHGFNIDTFWQDFVTVVRRRLEFDRIHVYVVLIDDVSSTLTVNFNKSWTIASGTRASAARVDILCTSSYVNIDTTAVESIRTSASVGFSFT